MSLTQGVKSIQGGTDNSLCHIFGFNTARSDANSILVDVWNGSTVATRRACIGKDGYFYSYSATAGDLPYFVAGGISNVKKMSYLNIGAANTILTSSGTAPQWSTSLAGLTSLAVDNILIDGNDISSTAGTDLTITPLAGQQIVLDGTIVVDAGVVTGATSISSTAFIAGAGAEATPSIAFTGDPDTGLYHGGADSFGLTAGDNQVLAISNTSATFYEDILIGHGAPATPSIRSTAAETGFYLSTTQVSTTIAGTEVIATTAATVDITGDLKFSGADRSILMDTADASDSYQLGLSGGGAIGPTRGAYAILYGNDDVAAAGCLGLSTGDAGSAWLRLMSSATVRIEIDDTGIGFFNTTPAARTAAYTPTNVTPDRSFDCDAVAVAELADVVATMIVDLQTYGLFQ